MIIDKLNFCLQFRLYQGDNKENLIIKQKTRYLINIALDTLSKDIRVFAIYINNYYESLDLTKDTLKKGFSFTFACKFNRFTWLIAERIHKTLKQHRGVKKISAIKHKELDIAAITFSNKQKMNEYRDNRDSDSEAMIEQAR